MVRFKKLIFRTTTIFLGLFIAQRLYLLTHRNTRHKVDLYAKQDRENPTESELYKDVIYEHDDVQITRSIFAPTSAKTLGTTTGGNPSDHFVIKDSQTEVETERMVSEINFISIMQQMQAGVTMETPVNLKQLRVVVEDVGVLSPDEYKIFKAKEFVRLFANPGLKSDIPPTLKPFPDGMERPSPYIFINDDRKVVAEDKVQDQWQKERKRRLSMGDEDISKLPEVVRVLERNTLPIPNIIHFIWFNCRKFRVHHYISFVSAWKIHSPELILFHTTCEPQGSYWNSFKDFANNTLKIVQRTPPVEVWGNPVKGVEHQSDVARLQILLEVGGIYMDDDVVVLKSLEPLRKEEMVLGEENFDAVANSVIMASKDSWFLKRWFQEYGTFNDSRWSDSSCFVPWSLWQLFPDTIHVVKEQMLRPNWEEIKYIYHELWNWHNSFTIHLYSRFMEAMEGTNERTLRELAILNTTYGEIARYIIWDDVRPRDITEWIF